jgi:thiol-disulfide isomerase/thioredoxin
MVLGLSCATTSPKPSVDASPDVMLLDGTNVAFPSLLAGDGNTLLVFATPWCDICRHERPQVVAWAQAHRDPKRTVYVFSGGQLPGVVDQIRALNLDTSALTVVIDANGRLADHFDVKSTPTLFVLGAQGRVLSSTNRFETVHFD